MIPERLRTFCALCTAEADSVEEMVTHLEQDHDLRAERWPDGGLVIDASDTPELMEER